MARSTHSAESDFPGSPRPSATPRYAIAGIVCCILIVTIPFGLASFRIADFALWPFGRRLVVRPDAGAPSVIGNVIWFVFAGWWLALAHLVTAVALAITIIGIPLLLYAWASS